MNSSAIRIICAVLVALIGAVIVLRRRGHKAE
jgi:hypothetical protein